MKRLLVILALLISFTGKSQIDLSCDATLVGVYPTVKITYPLYDKFIVGGSFGYNVLSPHLTERIDMVIGWKVDEQLQIELDAGVLSGFDPPPYDQNKQYMFHADLGAKFHFWSNAFFTMHVAYPEFAKLGLGFRLRPWKRLNSWTRGTFYKKRF